MHKREDTKTGKQDSQAFNELYRRHGAQRPQLAGVPVMFMGELKQVLPPSYLTIIPARAANENPTKALCATLRNSSLLEPLDP